MPRPDDALQALTTGVAIRQSATVSTDDKDANKRHRHDVGQVAHGAATYEKVTTAVQYTLAVCVLGSMSLVIYALVVSVN